MKRTANAVWNGTIKEGQGQLSTATGVLENTPYTFNSRFGDGGETNPEELIAAAHAGCYSMKLGGVLTEAGFKPESIEKACTNGLEGQSINTDHQVGKARGTGMEGEKV